MNGIHHAASQLAGLDFHELTQHAPQVLAELLPGTHLLVQSDERNSVTPSFGRGWHEHADSGLVYRDYYLGPPQTLQFAAHGLPAREARTSRAISAFFQLLRGALFSAGYQHELATHARTDWLTGLPRRHALERALHGITLNESAPLLLLALRLYPATPALSEGARLAVRTFIQILKPALGDGEQVFHLAGNDFAILASEANRVKLEGLIKQIAPPGYGLGFASSSETQGEALLQLAQQRRVLTGITLQPDGQVLDAASQLKPDSALLATLPSVPVVVHCEDALSRAALESLTENWFFRAPVHLLLDVPAGSALQVLRNTPRPVLVVTTSGAHGYLADLRSFEPEGLLTGQTQPAALREALLRLSRNETLDVGSSGEPAQLFPRERQVWSRVAHGWTNPEIAAELGISSKTVANYISNLQEKLRLQSRTSLALDYWRFPGVKTVPGVKRIPATYSDVIE